MTVESGFFGSQETETCRTIHSVYATVGPSTHYLFFRAIFKALLVAVQEGGVLRVDDAQISGQA